MLRKLALATLCVALAYPALADPPSSVPSTVIPTKITTGNTFQSIVAAATLNNRKSLTIENNNVADNCNLIIVGSTSPWVAGDTTASSRTYSGVTLTAAQDSILLLPGASYTRYYPLVPSDQILGTCASTGDSLHVDVQ